MANFFYFCYYTLMKIFIIASKNFYGKIPEIEGELRSAGHVLTMPNCYDDPSTEKRYKEMGNGEHSEWKAAMLKKSENTIKDIDACLVLNFDKNGVKNYIGGATFLEMYDAFRFNKKIFLYNDIPEGILYDEIVGFNPVVLNGDLKKIQ